MEHDTTRCMVETLLDSWPSIVLIFTYGHGIKYFVFSFCRRTDGNINIVMSFTRFRHFASLVVTIYRAHTRAQLADPTIGDNNDDGWITYKYAFFRNNTRHDYTHVMRRVIIYRMNNILPTIKSDSGWYTDTNNVRIRRTTTRVRGCVSRI